MNNNPINPLDNLTNYEQPLATRAHTSGRRELRSSLLSRPITIHAHPRSQQEASKATLTGEMVGTLPIRRAVPKRGGMTKKEWKSKEQREARQAARARMTVALEKESESNA